LVLIQHAVLDVNVLKMLHAVCSHVDLCSALISQKLLMLSLLLCLEWLCRNSKRLEGLWTKVSDITDLASSISIDRVSDKLLTTI